MQVKTERNHTLNYLKALACFCVVMLHCGFPGIVGKLIYGPSRFAVPIFFMISGYFVYDSDPIMVKKRLPRKIKHIVVLLLGTEFIYLIWHVIQHAIDSGINGIIIWFGDTFTIEKIVRFCLFQTTPIGDVSWFMVALLLCYAVTFAIARYNLWNKTSYMIPILLTINIVVGEILPFIGVNVQWYWCSNFWVLGFPFYAMGYWVRINQVEVCEKITARNTIILVALSLIVVTAERTLTSASQLFVGNILSAFALFAFCIKYPNMFQKSRIVEWIGNSAFYVYILHPIVRDIYNLILIDYINCSVVLWIRPVAVFVICLLVALVLSTIQKSINKGINQL